jgi:hypothetical protein
MKEPSTVMVVITLITVGVLEAALGIALPWLAQLISPNKRIGDIMDWKLWGIASATLLLTFTVIQGYLAFSDIRKKNGSAGKSKNAAEDSDGRRLLRFLSPALGFLAACLIIVGQVVRG